VRESEREGEFFYKSMRKGGRVRESKIKKIKNKKWERERESEREGELLKKWEREKESEREQD
jgi:hypothetical protein